MGAFDDLIPQAGAAAGTFDDLIPAADTARGTFDDLIPRGPRGMMAWDGAMRLPENEPVDDGLPGNPAPQLAGAAPLQTMPKPTMTPEQEAAGNRAFVETLNLPVHLAGMAAAGVGNKIAEFDDTWKRAGRGDVGPRQRATIQRDANGQETMVLVPDPYVGPFEAGKGLIPAKPKENISNPIVRAIAEAPGKLLEGATTPEMLATMGVLKASPGAAAPLFLPQTVPAAAQGAVQATAPGATPYERTQGGVNAVINSLFSAGMIHEGTKSTLTPENLGRVLAKEEGGQYSAPEVRNILNRHVQEMPLQPDEARLVRDLSEVLRANGVQPGAVEKLRLADDGAGQPATSVPQLGETTRVRNSEPAPGVGAPSAQAPSRPAEKPLATVADVLGAKVAALDELHQELLKQAAAVAKDPEAMNLPVHLPGMPAAGAFDDLIPGNPEQPISVPTGAAAEVTAPAGDLPPVGSEPSSQKGNSEEPIEAVLDRAGKVPRNAVRQPLPTEGREGYSILDAVKDHGRIGGPNFDEVVAGLKAGKTAAQIAGPFGGEYDALHPVIEDIGEVVRKHGANTLALKPLRTAYERAGLGGNRRGVDKTFSSLAEDRSGFNPEGGKPSTVDELISRAWSAARTPAAESPEVRQNRFTNAATAPASDEGLLKVSPKALQRGDVFHVRGPGISEHPVTVTHVAGDGTVQVKMEQGPLKGLHTLYPEPFYAVKNKGDANRLAGVSEGAHGVVNERGPTTAEQRQRQADDARIAVHATETLQGENALRRGVSLRPAGRNPSPAQTTSAGGASSTRSATGRGLTPAVHAQLERALGIRIVFVETNDGSPVPFHGAFLPGRNVLLIDAHSDMSPMAIIGHEFSHFLESANPELYQDMMDKLIPLMQNLPEFRQYLKQHGYGPELLRNPDRTMKVELVGNLFGDEFTRPEFWNRLAAEEPGLFKRLARVLVNWLNKLLAKLKGLKGYESEQYFSDLTKARTAVGEALAKYARGEGGSGAGEAGGEVGMSRRDGGVTETPEFKRWFGDSKVVDGQGKPMVVYHGGAKGITIFKPASADLGVHFTTDNRVANWFSEQYSERPKANGVTAAYLAIKNPLHLIDRGGFDAGNVTDQLVEQGIITEAQAEAINGMDVAAGQKAMRAAITGAGHDGVAYRNRVEIYDPKVGRVVDVSDYLRERPEKEVDQLWNMPDAAFAKLVPDAAETFIAFQPEQIKSPSNRGTFEVTNPDTRFSRKDVGGDMFSFEAPETVAEQKARQVAEEKQKSAADKLAERKAFVARGGERLTGEDVDTTHEMFGAEVKVDKAGQGSLFSRKVNEAGNGFVPPKYEIAQPIKGPTGAAIVGYEWRSKMGEKWSNREGGYVEGRVSDWDRSDTSSGTGRDIVHVFYVSHPNGNYTAEGIRSAQNVLGISETRLMTIAKHERAAQAYREQQEKAEADAYDKAAANTAAEAARNYRKLNYSPMRSFDENNAIFNASLLFEKGGKFVRRGPNAAEFMQRNGWIQVEIDPAKPTIGLDEKSPTRDPIQGSLFSRKVDDLPATWEEHQAELGKAGEVLRRAIHEHLRARELGVKKGEAQTAKHLAAARYRTIEDQLYRRPDYIKHLIEASTAAAKVGDNRALELLRAELDRVPKKMAAAILKEMFKDEPPAEQKVAARLLGIEAEMVSSATPAAGAEVGAAREAGTVSVAGRMALAQRELPGQLRDAWRGVKSFGRKLEGRWHARAGRDQMAYLFDAANTRGALFGTRTASLVRHELNRAFNAKDVAAKQDVRERALTFVVEGGRNKGELAMFRGIIEGSDFARTLWAQRALEAIKYAEEHFERLEPVARQYETITDSIVSNEQAAGIPTIRRDGGYVFHLQDATAGWDMLEAGSGGGGPGTPFRHIREHATYADSIAAGVVPETLSAVDLMQRRARMGATAINLRAWTNGFRKIEDPATKKPLVVDTEKQIRADGTHDVTAPAGYVKLNYMGAEMAVHQSYADLFKALTGESTMRQGILKPGIMKAASFVKHGTLLFDTYHLGRMAFWAAVARGDVLPQLPRYGKGLTLLDNTGGDIRQMVARKEIPEGWAKDMEANRRDLDLLIEHGLNIGQVSESIHTEWVQHLPIAGRFNRWLFQKYIRGAMAEAALIELHRQMKMTGADAVTPKMARAVASDLNVRFGSLGSQGLFKSKTMQDLSRLIFLASQWNESLIRSELGALKQIGVSIPQSVRARRLRMGLLGRSVGVAILGTFIANQIINWITRRKPTWENPEEGMNAKISAYIPDSVGGGPGFFLNPATLPAEISHLLIEKTERSGDFGKAVQEYAAGRLGPVGRVPYTLMARQDPMGHPIAGWDVGAQMALSLVPVPLSAGAIGRAGKQLVTGEHEEAYQGQFEKQAAQTFGVKLSNAPGPERRMTTLAHEFVSEHKATADATNFPESKYYAVRNAARLQNAREVAAALDELLVENEPPKVAQAIRLWAERPFTGVKRLEGQFKATLTPEQLAVYDQARADRREIKTRILEALPAATQRRREREAVTR